MCFNFSFKERDALSLKTLDSRGTLILSSSMEYTSHGVLGMLYLTSLFLASMWEA